MSTFISSTLSDAEDQNSSVSKFHPVDIDGNRILWGGNPAYLDGALYECQLFLRPCRATRPSTTTSSPPIRSKRAWSAGAFLLRSFMVEIYLGSEESLDSVS